MTISSEAGLRGEILSKTYKNSEKQNFALGCEGLREKR